MWDAGGMVIQSNEIMKRSGSSVSMYDGVANSSNSYDMSNDGDDDLDTFQILINDLLRECTKYEYRKVGSNLYRPVKMNTKPSNRYIMTGAWKFECSIKDFIYKSTRKHINLDMWTRFTRPYRTTTFRNTPLPE